MTSNQLPPLTEAEKNRLTDCVFYLKGSCTKGEKCEFRHIDYLVGKVCKHWLQGECREPKCSFRHPTIRTKVDPSQTVCYFYTIGACTKGNKCPFIHDKTKVKEKPKKKSLFSAAMKKLKEQEKKDETKRQETKLQAKKIIQRYKLSEVAKQKILNAVNESQKSNGASTTTSSNQQKVEQQPSTTQPVQQEQNTDSAPKIRKIKINRKRILSTTEETSPNKKLKTEEDTTKKDEQPTSQSVDSKNESQDKNIEISKNDSKENENSSQDNSKDNETKDENSPVVEDDDDMLLAEVDRLLAETS